MKHLSRVKFTNMCINPTPQLNSDRFKDVSDNDGKDDEQRIFKNECSCFHPGVIFEARVWPAYITLWVIAI